ncbi:WGR domain-containing protein [Niallia sp. Krafla_26]|uniref:WGR domain-containing protein n=1 Tax=Niallia sp. Krafla_26 TaxID=3064703 RepID=UPI003D175A06
MTKTFAIHVKDFPSFSITQVEQRVVLHYMRIQTNTSKFYIMEFQEGVGDCPFRIYVEYGRMGSPPRKHERYFRSRLEARKEFDRTLTTKHKKGYELILIEEDWDDFSHLMPIEDSIPNSDSLPPTIYTPLGKLSEIQIQRGIHILNEIEQRLRNGREDIIDLSNQFYSVIPVALGSQIDKGCLLDTVEKVDAKKEWLNQMIYG